jgi:hypothetical protein
MSVLTQKARSLAKATALTLCAGALLAPTASASQLLTENSNYKRSHSGDAVPAAPLSENSYYRWSHSSDSVPAAPVSENSYYKSQHSNDAVAAAPVSENSYYRWAHQNDPQAAPAAGGTRIVVRTVTPSTAFDFGAAAIGAAAAFGAALLGAGSLLAVRSRRRLGMSQLAGSS